MWNLWGYLSPNTHNPHHQDQPLSLDYAKLHPLFTDITAAGPNTFAHPSSQMAQTFEDLMGTLHGLLNIIIELKQEHQNNLAKLQEYDHLKALVGQHTSMITALQSQNCRNLTKIYNDKIKQYQRHEEQMKCITTQLVNKTEEMKKMQISLEQMTQQNHTLQSTLSHKQNQIASLKSQLQRQSVKLEAALSIRNRTQDKREVKPIGKINLEVIFYYSKLRKNVYQFLQVQDFGLLSQLSKQMNLTTSETFRDEYLAGVFKSQRQKNQSVFSYLNDYKKVYDRFPAENIRSNAIKYLFFKIKPGSYLLPFFQEEPPEGKGSRWAIWKKKEEPEAGMHRGKQNSTLALLKDDGEFKEIQKRVDTFFDRLFEIQLPQDLKNFTEIMESQLGELKRSMNDYGKSEQLLCLSRYLFLETSELNNLLQVCFALLINSAADLKEVKKKYDDVRENDQVLRNLVDSLAKDRSMVEKRVWFLENENISYKNQASKICGQVERLWQQNQKIKEEMKGLESENRQMKAGGDKDRRERKKLEAKLQQISSLLSSSSFID